MKKIAALMAISFTAALALAGCNTMEGAGQDVQKAGQKLERSADQKK